MIIKHFNVCISYDEISVGDKEIEHRIYAVLGRVMSNMQDAAKPKQ